MVVFECSDKLTRLYSMGVYCLEYRQAAKELRYDRRGETSRQV
jgi:hypothetical protein